MDLVVSSLLERCESLIAENAVLARALARAQQACTQQAAAHARQLQALQAELTRLGGQPCAEPAPAPAAPASRAVLCVGGRTASVPVYRRLVEGQGGRFLHHDGGTEPGSGQLESTLAAADLVICQTGCISHNAYWRVKDHCRRTGKECVFVESPSAGSLRRVLPRPESEQA